MKKNLYACMDRHRKVMKLILMMKATFILSVLFCAASACRGLFPAGTVEHELGEGYDQTSYRGDQAEHGIQFRV